MRQEREVTLDHISCPIPGAVCHIQSTSQAQEDPVSVPIPVPIGSCAMGIKR